MAIKNREKELKKQVKTEEGKEALLAEAEGTPLADQAKALVDERTKVEKTEEQLDLQKVIGQKEFNLGIVERQIKGEEEQAKNLMILR